MSLFCMAGLVLALALAVAVSHLAGGLPGTLVLAAGCLAAIATSAWILWHQQQEEILVVSTLAEELAPELGTSASSAVDLAARLGEERFPFSRDLAQLHVETTAVHLAELPLQKRLNRRQREVRRAGAATLLAAVLSAAAGLAFLDTGSRRLLAWILEPSTATFSDTPLAGDIRITYHYPAYTGLPSRVVVGGDGSISAVLGSEVEIHGFAEFAVRQATLRLVSSSGGDDEAQDIPMRVDEDRQLSARFPVLRDGEYHLALVDTEGELREERYAHPISALLDDYPTVVMEYPMADVEFKDTDDVLVTWRARDDYGVAEVDLVVEQPPGADRPGRIPLARPDRVDPRRSGRYKWSIATLRLAPGESISFYLEAVDNDPVSGPKRATSKRRRLELFSAQRLHEKLLSKQRQALDRLIAYLALELTGPFPSAPNQDLLEPALGAQRRILAAMEKAASELQDLCEQLRTDELSTPAIGRAFENILDHLRRAWVRRERAVARSAAPTPSKAAWGHLAQTQRQDIDRLERDIVYLDDLLALQRIEQLKQTAKELLAAQRDLKQLLKDYRDSADPALRAELQARIADLRGKMLDLLAKMAQIKQRLPGEYRNLEAVAQLRIEDQLVRLDRLVRQGDLEAAARELEQLANMVDNMVESITQAQQLFGGEEYAALRRELTEFANAFKVLESEQQSLAKRTQGLLDEYRDKAVAQVGKSLQDFVKSARARTADALRELDRLAAADSLLDLPAYLERSREQLIDLDALLAHKDFAEARRLAESAAETTAGLHRALRSRARYLGGTQVRKQAKTARRAAARAEDVAQMLRQLFPDPSEILDRPQMAQMARMARKQAEVERRARGLGEQMEQLAAELPLFGAEPRTSLEAARGEMAEASSAMEGTRLGQAAHHERRAVEELGKIRKALEQAARGSSSGLPLPLGWGRSPDRGGGRQFRSDDVQIPEADGNRHEPRYRQELLDASKQKAPLRYEDAVRRYYEELIR